MKLKHQKPMQTIYNDGRGTSVEFNGYCDHKTHVIYKFITVNGNEIKESLTYHMLKKDFFKIYN